MPLVGSPKANRWGIKVQPKKTLMKSNNNGNNVPLPQSGSPGLHSGAKPGSGAHWRILDVPAFTHWAWPGTAQRGDEDHHVWAKGLGEIGDVWRPKAGTLAIWSLARKAGSWDMEYHLSSGEGAWVGVWSLQVPAKNSSTHLDAWLKPVSWEVLITLELRLLRGTKQEWANLLPPHLGACTLGIYPMQVNQRVPSLRLCVGERDMAVVFAYVPDSSLYIPPILEHSFQVPCSAGGL